MADRRSDRRTFRLLVGIMLASSAVATLLSAAKNGLFLSVYPADLIPAGIVAASLVTAAFALFFTGLVGLLPNRTLSLLLYLIFGATVIGGRIVFEFAPRSAFALYVWLSTVQALTLARVWQVAGSSFPGARAKRVLPLTGLGGSVATILMGLALTPLTAALGTADLLWVCVGLLATVVALFLALPDADEADTDGEAVDPGPSSSSAGTRVRSFAGRAMAGARTILGSPLLRSTVAAGVLLVLASTLIDFYMKITLQANFDRDRITSIYGLLAGIVGASTLVVQLLLSRVVFPRFGVSFAARIQPVALTAAAAGVALSGAVWVIVALRGLDDLLRQGIERPVEQVTLGPLARQRRAAASGTIGGVISPLARAGAGAATVLFVVRPGLLPYTIIALCLGAAFALRRYRSLYLAALESALDRHTLSLSRSNELGLILDRETLDVLERGLGDPDPQVVVFAVSLLREIPLEDQWRLLEPLLDHPSAGVRGAVVTALSRSAVEEGTDLGARLDPLIDREDHPDVLVALAEGVEALGGSALPGRLVDLSSHPHSRVRRSALVARVRSGDPEAPEEIDRLAASTRIEERGLAVEVVGHLGHQRRLDLVEAAARTEGLRPHALEALSALGRDALPLLENLLVDDALPLPFRRSLVTLVGRLDGEGPAELLLGHLDDTRLFPAVVTTLRRMRHSGQLDPVPLHRLRMGLRRVADGGLRMLLAADRLERAHAGRHSAFAVLELRAMARRSLYRVLNILALRYSPGRVGALETGLFSDRSDRRAKAYELLETTLRDSGNSGVLRLAAILSEQDGPGMGVHPGLPRTGDPEEVLGEEPDPWARAIVRLALERPPEPLPGVEATENDVVSLIERVMVLKGSDLFRGFPGEELMSIADVAEEQALDAGQLLFEQGDPGHAFFMIVSGEVSVSRDGIELARLGPREGLGEMAILDRDTRSATARAAEPTTLLRIDRDDFDSLVEHNPSIARGIYRVLTQRLRSTLAQIASG